LKPVAIYALVLVLGLIGAALLGAFFDQISEATRYEQAQKVRQ
jgi:hypothetical protein